MDMAQKAKAAYKINKFKNDMTGKVNDAVK